MEASRLALMERNLGLSYEQRLHQLMCANRFVHALRGDEVRFAHRRYVLPHGSFQPEEILLALSRHEVPFVVIGDWAAAARGFDEPVMLLEVAIEASAEARDALAAAAVALDAEAIGGGSLSASTRTLSLTTIFGGLEVTLVPPREFASLRARTRSSSVRGSPVRTALR